jgi:predicted transglutaminase-like cysteine proteinase
MRVFIVCLMLSACTTSNTLKPVLGDESYVPSGWVQYCNDNPGECKN